MSRVLALLALVILAPRASAQDTEDDTGLAWLDGAVGASDEEGGGPACACAPGVAAPSVGPMLVALALVARRRRIS